MLDLGSGTGILGLLACQAGASRVYAVDAGGMAQPARAIARANALDDRITVIDGFSTDIDIPERADVLVTDQIGQFGFDAGIVKCVADARRRLLKPEPRLIPARVDLWIAPLESPALERAVDFWRTRPAGFDMSPLYEMAANSGHPRRVRAEELLAPAVCGGSIDLAVDHPMLRLSTESMVARPGTLHGIAGWFSSMLAPGIHMSNSPLAANRIDRRSAVFPVATPTPVTTGDRIRTTMRILPDDLLVSWTVETVRGERLAPAVRFNHSTLRGMLLAPDRLKRTRPDYVPLLNARGEARRSVLALCDGGRTLEEIEREVYARHAAIFRDRSDAELFVAEVVVGYCR